MTTRLSLEKCELVSRKGLSLTSGGAGQFLYIWYVACFTMLFVAVEVDMTRSQIDAMLMQGLEAKGFMSGLAGVGFAYPMSCDSGDMVLEVRRCSTLR